MRARWLRLCAVGWIAALSAYAAGSSSAVAARPGSVAMVRAPGLMLAIGDSLAAGYQPTDGESAPPVNPATGWPDQGYPHGYAADLAATEHLKLTDLGCPGETTSSYTTVPAKRACATLYSGEFGAANQQAAALAFFAAHPGEVRLVTFDLGGNDLDGCLSGSGANASCLTSRTAEVVARLPKLLATIHAVLAKDDRRATLVAMDYYDPFLGLAENPGGASGRTLATLSVGALEAFNASLHKIYLHAGALVAEVSSKFQTTALLPRLTYGGKRLPRNVALICRWTYMCPLPGSASSATVRDPHPNDAGYARIAAAFRAALARRRAR